MFIKSSKSVSDVLEPCRAAEACVCNDLELSRAPRAVIFIYRDCSSLFVPFPLPIPGHQERTEWRLVQERCENCQPTWPVFLFIEMSHKVDATSGLQPPLSVSSWMTVWTTGTYVSTGSANGFSLASERRRYKGTRIPWQVFSEASDLQLLWEAAGSDAVKSRKAFTLSRMSSEARL